MSSHKPKPRRDTRTQPAPDPVKEFCTAAKREMVRYKTEQDAQKAMVLYVQSCSERAALHGEPFVYDCERCGAYHVDPNVEGNRQFCHPACKVKHLYATEFLAGNALFWQQTAHAVGGTAKPFRKYYCTSCEGWHLTTKMYAQV